MNLSRTKAINCLGLFFLKEITINRLQSPPVFILFFTQINGLSFRVQNLNQCVQLLLGQDEKQYVVL